MAKSKIVVFSDILKDKYLNSILLFSDVKSFYELIFGIKDAEEADIKENIIDKLDMTDKIQDDDKFLIEELVNFDNYKVVVIDKETKSIVNEDYLISKAKIDLLEHTDFIQRLFSKKNVGCINNRIYYDFNQKKYFMDEKGEVSISLENAILALGFTDNEKFVIDKVY